VALQLPTSGDSSGSLARLTDKFPSDTPLWQVLRRFEDGSAGNASGEETNHNFTQRATPVTADGSTSGGGRLNYEMPVVNIMGRELATFVDLQKSMSQLGFNSGSCLMRLNYRDSGQPMSEAMEQITQYFKSIEPPTAATDTHGAHGRDVGEVQSSLDVDGSKPTDSIAGEEVSKDDHTTESTNAEPDVSIPFASPNPRDSPMPDFDNSTSTSAPLATTSQTLPDPSASTSNPSISIFSAPTATTSHTLAASTTDESDYTPTLDHAHLHQARLAASTRNRKLLSDSELATAQQTRTAALAQVKEVLVRIRFPDQSMAQRSFGQDAVVADVYAMCREVMESPEAAFELRVPGVSDRNGVGGMVSLKEQDDDGKKKLIAGLGWQGRVLVTVVWGEGVSQEVRDAPSLKKEYRAKAEEIKLPVLQDEEPEKGKAVPEDGVKKDEKPKKSGDKESRMRGLLKGLSKK
jgi:tether containing UBX domain for GLUT4